MAARVRPPAGAGHGCLLCGTGPLVPCGGGRRPRSGTRALVHRGRGLCAPCHDEEDEAGRLAQWPRLTWCTEDLAERAERIKRGRWDASWADIADELGVKVGTLTRAVHRQRAVVRASAGDGGR